MNKIVLFILLMALGLLLTATNAAFAWSDCPRGLTNDPYPGADSNYSDTNDDGICDHSQPAPAIISQPTKITDYHLLPISVSLTFLYSVSLFLSKKNIISPTTHRKIWNFFLLISFLICGISGLLLILRLNFGLNLPNYTRIVFDHVEFGIATTAVAFFHILRHLSYFKNLFKNNLKMKE